MGAQGWHRDPFGLHDDRWLSRGRPTRLVRDQGAESYDEPPGDLPAPPDSADEADRGELTRARLLASRIVPAASRAPAASRLPVRNWRYWTVWPPCLLTLALSLWFAIGITALSTPPSNPDLNATELATSGPIVGAVLLDCVSLVVATIAAIIVLYVAADRMVSRRACALAGWVITLLAYGFVALVSFASTLGSGVPVAS